MSRKTKIDLWGDKTNVTYQAFKIDRNEKPFKLGFRYRVGVVRQDGQRVTNTQIGTYTRLKTAEGVAKLLNQSLKDGGSVEWEFLPDANDEEEQEEPTEDSEELDFSEDFDPILDAALEAEWRDDPEYFAQCYDRTWTVAGTVASLIDHSHEDDE